MRVKSYAQYILIGVNHILLQKPLLCKSICVLRKIGGKSAQAEANTDSQYFNKSSEPMRIVYMEKAPALTLILSLHEWIRNLKGKFELSHDIASTLIE